MAEVVALLVVRPPTVDWPVLAAVVACHGLAAWLSFPLPWNRWSPWARLSFPLCSWLSLVAVVQAAPGLSGVFSGVFVLSFAYIGLHLPRRSGLVLLAPGVVAYLAAYVTSVHAVTEQLTVRVLFVAVAWVVLAPCSDACSGGTPRWWPGSAPTATPMRSPGWRTGAAWSDSCRTPSRATL